MEIDIEHEGLIDCFEAKYNRIVMYKNVIDE
jgi:hypothetical protein